jgi:ATP-dependent Clp protease protease subunit
MNKHYRKEDEEEITAIKKEEKWGEDYYFKILNKERYILLYSPIMEESADIIVTKIKSMNILDNKKEIIIEINSIGGDVSAGFSIINAIEQSKAPIHTIISGQVCSMAAMISIVGKKRSIYYNSFWMNHPLSEGQMDYLQFIKDRTKFLIHLDAMTENLLKKYTKLNKQDLRKIATGELWLSAEECLRKGIVDRIIK